MTNMTDTNTRFVYSYAPNPQGLQQIAQADPDKLKLLRIRKANSKFKGSSSKSVINWGYRGVLPEEVTKCKVINTPKAVDLASNKLKFFSIVQEKCKELDIEQLTPPFTTDKDEVLEWISSPKSKTVFARTELNGNSGAGIVEISNKDGEITSVDDIEDAPLYTMFIPKRYEFRIHVWNGEVFDIQQKRRSYDTPDELVNWRIRSYDNGFIFARSDVRVPNNCKVAAVEAVKMCGLTFGAVDVIYNELRNRAYVLEVNTAPGVTGTTASKYVDKFISVE